MDESWRPILRLFRIVAESRENLISFAIVVGLIIMFFIVLQILLYMKRRIKQNREEWDWFYRMSEAKDLSVKEMKLLRDMVNKAKIHNPVRIFKSIRLFDRCVNVILKYNAEKEEELSDELSEIRNKLHFDRFPPGKILESTRGIIPEQRIRITFNINGEEYHTISKVTGVDEGGITILVPTTEKYKEAFKAGNISK